MHLQTLGTPELRGDGPSPTAVLGAGKPLALLIYLSTAPGRTASRPTLFSLLWADLEADAARHNLRQALWYIRRRTGRETVTPQGDALQLVPDVTTDRDQLLDASARGDHQRVVDLYAGPFVPDFAAPGGSGFEEWSALERRRLLECFRHSADAVIRERLAQGRARDAIPLARKLRDQDMYNEGGWRLLLEVCTAADDALAARAEAEALRQLAEQHDLELEPATLSALRRPAAQLSPTGTGATHAPDRVAGPLAATLVGRESAFSALLAAWDAARAGRTARVHVAARPGIGKTRLLRDFGARLRSMRAKVVSITGSLGMRDVGSGLAGELAVGLAALPGRRGLSPQSAATLIDLNPTLSTWFEVPARGQTPGDAMRSRALALRELAIAVSSEQPVAVLIDDLHWSDEESAAIISACADGLRDARVLLLTAGRPEARRIPFVTHEGTQHVDLHPLTVSQVEELVLSIASLPVADWSRDFAAELWRASRGSPLLALELLQLLEDRKLLERVDGAWGSGRPDLLLAALRTGDVLRARLEDMDRFDRWLLTLLAAAGAPLDSRALVEASERPDGEVRDRLRSLEGRGLTTAERETWSIAHDEIAEELLRLTNTESQARAASRVGRALLGAPAHDEVTARRAAQLLRQTDDAAARGDLLRRFARHRYELGDRRPVRALASELFGATTERAQLTSAVAAAPWSWRLGLVSPLRRLVAGIGAGLVVAIVALRFLLAPPRLPPDAELAVVVADSTGRVGLERVELYEDAWEPQQPLSARAWEGPGRFTLKSTSGFGAAWHARRSALITSEAVDDDGAMELFLHQRGREPRRLAPAPGDDQGVRVSPDGTRLAFFTARWDSLSRYDIAVTSLEDSVVTRLTSGPSTDVAPTWAPDGLHIAFSRENWGRAPNESCAIHVTTRDLRCVALSAGSTGVPLAWLDDDRVVLHHRTGPFGLLGVLQWSTGELTTVTEISDASAIVVSDDGRWVFCVCTAAAGTARRPTVFPLAAPRLAREVELADSARHVLSAVFTSSRAGLDVARIRIDGAAVYDAPAHVPVQLRASVLDANGRVVAYHGAVRWTVADPAAGTIDSISGVLVATGRTPVVTVRAIAGPTVRDSVRLPVSSDAGRVAFTETWDDTTMTRWLPYGRPAPRVVPFGDGRHAFLNNGEGSFDSGAASRETFDARHGLAVDIEVSATVTRPQWQVLSVQLTQNVDTLLYRGAAGRNITPTPGSNAHLCGFGFPIEGRAGEGEGQMQLVRGGGQSTFPVPDNSWLSGAWHRVRIQLLPDGRCGIALDGVPHSILPAGNQLRGPVRVVMAGNSAGTQMLVGRVQVHEGVPRDIDWTRARLVP